MSILAWIEDQKRLKVLNAPKYVSLGSDSSKGLWTRCDKCGVILYIKHLKENQRVCFGCSYHLQMSSQERIESLLDRDSWNPLDETVSPCDPLLFHDQRAYTDRLQDAQEKTGLQDAIQTGTGMVDGIPVALGVMDFDFMGGSMGSVVGEKLTRLIEYATQEGLTLLVVCASGGARMQEGVFSLMQMAKVSSALQIYQSCAALLYISILTSPTTGGVTASFAMLGDIIFAEPKALIAFAGRRVIEQTLREDLPDDFQTSEYMLHHGLVDLIVPRRFLRQALSETIKLYQNAPFKRVGRIPFGVQNPISFLAEEKIRRKWGILTLATNNSNAKTVLPEVQGLAWDGESVKNFTLESDALLRYSASHAELPLSPKARARSFASLNPLGMASSRLAHSNRERANPSHLFDNDNTSKEKVSVQNKDAFVSQRRVSCSKGGWLEHEHKPEQRYVPLQKKQLFDKIRQSIEYREILTSFEIVFNLFSREKYTSFNNTHGQSFALNPFVDTPSTKAYTPKADARAVQSRHGQGKSLNTSEALLRSPAIIESEAKPIFDAESFRDTATKQSFVDTYRPLLRIQGPLKKSKNTGGLQDFGVKKNIWNGLKCAKQSFVRTYLKDTTNRKNRMHAQNFLQSRASYLYKRFVPQKALGQDTIFYVPLIHIAIKHASGAFSTQKSHTSDRGSHSVKRARQEAQAKQASLCKASSSRALPLPCRPCGAWPAQQGTVPAARQLCTVKTNQLKLKNGKLPQPLLLHEWKSFSEKLALHNYKQGSKQLHGFRGKAVSTTHNKKSNDNTVYEPYKTKPCTCLHSISWSTNDIELPNVPSTSTGEGSAELEPLQKTTVYAPIKVLRSIQSNFDSIKSKVAVENNGASENKNTSVQGKALYAHQTNINFLNQAIELAATESVEWRAFYLHQRIEKTTGFLEDFIQPALLADPAKRQLAVLHAKQEENLLFYRSICRSSFC